jgi:hypothetical protein
MKRIKTIWFLIVLLPATAFSMQTILTPSISVRTEYTDNVDRVRDDPEHDFITSISPSLSLDLLGKTSSLSTSYSTSKVYYARKPEEDDFWRHNFNLNGHSQLTKHVNFTIGGSYLRSEDEADIEDPTNTIPDYTRRNQNFTYHVYGANAGLDYQFGEKDRIGFGFDYGGTENEEPTLEDSYYYRPSLDFSYWFTHQWGTELSGSYEKGFFDYPEEVVTASDTDEFEDYFGSISFLYQFNRQLTGNVKYTHTQTVRILHDTEEEEDRSHDVSIGFDYEFDLDTSLGMSIGYSIVEEDGEEDETGLSASLNFSKSVQQNTTIDFSVRYSIVDRKGFDNETGLSGSFNLSRDFKKGSLGINASSGYDYTFYGAENLGFTYYAGGGLTGNYDFTSRLSGNANATYRFSKYLEQTPEREDHRFFAGCGLSFQLLEWLYANAGYRFSTTESTEDENEFLENRVYVGLTATKDFLIWR